VEKSGPGELVVHLCLRIHRCSRPHIGADAARPAGAAISFAFRHTPARRSRAIVSPAAGAAVEHRAPAANLRGHGARPIGLNYA
ncbi:unnamed protein product, partial [Acidocella sp. C78]